MVYPIWGNYKFQRDGWIDGGRERERERERERGGRERKDSTEREREPRESSKILILKDNRDRQNSKNYVRLHCHSLLILR